jgi:hypothetical protein
MVFQADQFRLHLCACVGDQNAMAFTVLYDWFVLMVLRVGTDCIHMIPILGLVLGKLNFEDGWKSENSSITPCICLLLREANYRSRKLGHSGCPAKLWLSSWLWTAQSKLETATLSQMNFVLGSPKLSTVSIVFVRVNVVFGPRQQLTKCVRGLKISLHTTILHGSAYIDEILQCEQLSQWVKLTCYWLWVWHQNHYSTDTPIWLTTSTFLAKCDDPGDLLRQDLLKL